MAVRLSIQQRNLVKGLMKGMTITEAAVTAGYSDKNPAQSGSQALDSIRLKMPEVLDRAGLTDEVLIEKYLRPALVANDTEFAKFEGKITDQVEVVAWSPRLTALDMAFNLKGSYAPKQTANTTNLGIGFKVVLERMDGRASDSASAETVSSVGPLEPGS